MDVAFCIYSIQMISALLSSMFNFKKEGIFEMPRKTKAEKAAEVAAEVKENVTETAEVVEDVAEAVAEEKPKKRTTKKAAATKKTTTPRKTTKKEVEPAVDFTVEFNGKQESYVNIVENVKKSYLSDNEGAVVTDIKIYLKPQDNKAYCVINGEINYDIDVYFC